MKNSGGKNRKKKTKKKTFEEPKLIKHASLKKVTFATAIPGTGGSPGPAFT